MRKLETTLLKNYLRTKGKLAKEHLAIESKVSFAKIKRLLRGYRTASELEMESLSRVTGIELDVLFPIDNGKQATA